jgi:dTDP-4-dehydrorhamnose 3,5-epimerase-like enzyme
METTMLKKNRLNIRCDSMHMSWMPEGFTHGFVVLSDAAELFA